MSASLDIVSVGMVTAVGLDAPSSCAAMRARLDGFQETRFVGGSSDWVVGAPVCLPRPWIGEERLARMAAAAISEALEPLPKARNQTPIILCLAEQERHGQPYSDGRVLLRDIAAIAEIETGSGSRVVTHGRPSGHVALGYARKLLTSGEASHVMIAGVDTYLTSAALSYYTQNDRILAPDNPNGFIPGEAAAAVLCGRPQKGFGLYGLGLAREKASIYNSDDLPMRGDGMTEAYQLALAECGIRMNRLGYRIADLIGEAYWFKQSALSSLRLLRNHHDFQDLWSPRSQSATSAPPSHR